MGERAHRSIGEVLSFVQEDFPDVTISKIRFLESQGLLDPERTPSGYRKFYPADVERLQWILAQQRDHFLPLKIIRERLDVWDATGTAPRDAPIPVTTPMVTLREADVVESSEDPSEARRAASSLAAASAMEVVPPQPAPTASSAATTHSGDAAADHTGRDVPADEAESASPNTQSTEPVPDAEPKGETAAAPLRVGPEDTALTAEELAARAGVDVAVVRELESYSMIESHRVGPESYFEPEHLEVVNACKAFLDHGIEVRHLRMYKISAEREAGVYEQLVMPLLKQRNPTARARAVELVESLAEVGEELHAALLRQVLRQTLP